MNKKFLHVSKHDLGEKFKFTPRIPENAVLDYEGDIPRVCVSTNLYDCVRGVLGEAEPVVADFAHTMRRWHTERSRGMYYEASALYGTNRKAFLPPDHGDFRDNQEHWFLTPVTMYRLGYIDLRAFFQFCELKIVPERQVFQYDEASTWGNLDDSCAVIQDTKVKDEYEGAKLLDADIVIVNPVPPMFISQKLQFSDTIFEIIKG